MRTTSLLTACGLLAACFIGLTGCGKGNTNVPKGEAAAHRHRHDHGLSRGPHGGHVVGLEETEDYHVELTHDAASHRVGVYVLGEDAVTVVPIDAPAVTIDAVVGDASVQYTLPAVAQPGEAAGKSSYFEAVSEPLDTIVSGKLGSPIGELQFNVTIDGKPHVGIIGLHDLGSAETLGDASAAPDDALMWRQEVNEQGYTIALGHHGSSLLAGSKVEPAVQVTREGEPVADAKVFNALLDADGKTILAEEVATVYEPPTTDEPSHYAQGALKIPSGTRQVVIRFRVVLPEGKGERTFDVPVDVK